MQVMDPISGWAAIRPYRSETWKFLRAAFKCPFFLLSATMEETSLSRILGNIMAIEICINCYLKVLSRLKEKI